MPFVSFCTLITLFGAWLMPPIFGSRAVRAGVGAAIGIPCLLIFANMVVSSRDSAAVAMSLATLVFFAWIGSWLYEPALRAYYHMTPHPAAEMIEQAIYDGEPLDASVANALRSVEPTGDRIHDEVVAEQARSLARQAHGRRQRLAREEIDRMAAERARLGKANELERAQLDLAEAALAYEKQAARVAVLREET